MSERRYTTTSDWFEVTEPVGVPRLPTEPGRWRWLHTATTGSFVRSDGSERFIVIWTWENDLQASRDALDVLVQRSFGAP